MSTDAQRKASKKYLDKLDEIRIRIKQDGTKEQIAAVAKKRGLSINAYILGLIEKDMQDAKDEE